MWVINCIKTRVDGGPEAEVEAAMERLVMAEVSACRHCSQVHKLTGMIPVVCELEDVVRDWTWIQDIEERARMEVEAALAMEVV